MQIEDGKLLKGSVWIGEIGGQVRKKRRLIVFDGEDASFDRQSKSACAMGISLVFSETTTCKSVPDFDGCGKRADGGATCDRANHLDTGSGMAQRTG